MSDFKKQIEEDIKEYQENYKYISNIEKDEWAFNYWVLDKLFYEDEELVEEKIVDYHDLGIDAYEIYEDTKDIFLIQNKYYGETTGITSEYVKNDFLLRAITALENGTYKKSDELQGAFSKYKDSADFTVHLQLFVTNNIHNKEADEYVKKFNVSHPKYIAKIFYLDDIEERYYGETQQIKKNISVKVESVNKGTILNINTEGYKLENVIDARYVLTPVVSVYRLYRDSIEKGYPIFDKNIREYLGNKGVNSHIAKTLEDENDRDNFFYYNNGITVICDSVQKITLNESIHNKGFKTENPQIVNGCQTVNTIFETLNKYPESELENTFKNTYVMVKLLVLDKNSDSNKKLYQDIVKYNNSQNAISEKNFAANKRIFLNLQDDLRDLGFLLTVKQSDSNKFKTQENFNTYRPKLQKYTELFGVEFNRLEDNIIQLDKFLQVLLAFKNDGYDAFTKKSKILKVDSPIYNDLIEFIKNGSLTKNDYINLYLLFLKAEKEKKSSDDQRTPIPYYLLSFLGRDLKGLDGEQTRKCFRYIFENKENLNAIYSFYKRVTKRYKINMKNDKGIEYNKMIKTQIDNTLLEKTISDELEMEENSENKKIVNNFRNHIV